MLCKESKASNLLKLVEYSGHHIVFRTSSCANCQEDAFIINSTLPTSIIYRYSSLFPSSLIFFSFFFEIMSHYLKIFNEAILNYIDVPLTLRTL
jgi:hypothetical protein